MAQHVMGRDIRNVRMSDSGVVLELDNGTTFSIDGTATMCVVTKSEDGQDAERICFPDVQREE